MDGRTRLDVAREKLTQTTAGRLFLLFAVMALLALIAAFAPPSNLF